MDATTRKLIAEVNTALHEIRRQHEALTMMFDSLVKAADELEAQADHRTLRSVG